MADDIEALEDRLAWRGFLFAFLTLVSVPFGLFFVSLPLALMSEYYAFKANNMARERDAKPNVWGRIAVVLSPLLVIWMAAATISEFI